LAVDAPEGLAVAVQFMAHPIADPGGQAGDAAALLAGAGGDEWGNRQRIAPAPPADRCGVRPGEGAGSDCSARRWT
jgi:hypothetical protein